MALGLAGLAGLTLLTACTPDGEVPPDSFTEPHQEVQLTLGVTGPAALVSAYREIADAFSATHDKIDVTVKAYDSTTAEMTAVTAGGDQRPDLFGIDIDQLPQLMAAHATQPVDTLLGDRQVEFGDGYARNALEAFSMNTALQCMPTTVSPLVVYYNTALVNLHRVRDGASQPVNADLGWNYQQFRTAVAQASRDGHRGLYVAPDLTQVAPFVWSAGGQVADNAQTPSTLSFSSGSAEQGMQDLLEIVRNPRFAFDQAQTRGGAAIRLFERGKLAMILGYRDLVPTLRAVPGLNFDVMPMPIIGKAATSAQISGTCLSATTRHPSAAADFLAYLVGNRSMATLARTGYVVPANLAASATRAFLQPGTEPASAGVFTAQVRNVRLFPTVPGWSGATALVDAAMEALFYDPVIDPLAGRLTKLDASSQALFTPSTPAG